MSNTERSKRIADLTREAIELSKSLNEMRIKLMMCIGEWEALRCKTDDGRCLGYKLDVTTSMQHIAYPFVKTHPRELANIFNSLSDPTEFIRLSEKEIVEKVKRCRTKELDVACSARLERYAGDLSEDCQ